MWGESSSLQATFPFHYLSLPLSLPPSLSPSSLPPSSLPEHLLSFCNGQACPWSWIIAIWKHAGNLHLLGSLLWASHVESAMPFLLQTLMTQLLWLLNSQCSHSSPLWTPYSTWSPNWHTHRTSTLIHQTWRPTTHAHGHLWVWWLCPVGHVNQVSVPFRKHHCLLCNETLDLLSAGGILYFSNVCNV